MTREVGRALVGPRVEGDGHVHLYAEFDFEEVVAAALERSRRSQYPELLLVVDPERSRGFAALRDLDGVTGTAEASSLQFATVAGECFAIAGRQFVSSEGLEVLALGLDPGSELAGWPDRQRPARALVEAVLGAGAAAVLPWGVGKWLGARGSLVESLCEEPSLRREPLFLLGDVAQRCRPWPRPGVFDRGLRVLCGSDPLPVPGAERRIGRYGFRMACQLDPAEPARSFLQALGAGAALEVRGHPESLASALGEQWRYRRRSRSR